jgi:hypothetical protein
MNAARLPVKRGSAARLGLRRPLFGLPESWLAMHDTAGRVMTDDEFRQLREALRDPEYVRGMKHGYIEFDAIRGVPAGRNRFA